MKDFIDKLIGRLKKEQSKGIYDSDNVITVKGAYGKSISIVNQLAEEHNGGWIPCSERLPSYDGPFICTAKGIEESLELIYSSWDNSWMDELDSEYEVIAWQPLPEPYTKGE